MSGILRVRWTITPHSFPKPWLACSRCGGLKPFRCSEKFRLNANGKRLDAWLIYRCTDCGNTWNRPLFERRHRDDVDPLMLQALQMNDPDHISRFACDAAELRRHANRVEGSADVGVRKEILSAAAPTCGLEILLAVSGAAPMRTDRLLAAELGLSRKRIEELQSAGRFVVAPGGDKALARAVRDGTCIGIDLDPEGDGNDIARAAGP
jgi:hypothetical protein